MRTGSVSMKINREIGLGRVCESSAWVSSTHGCDRPHRIYCGPHAYLHLYKMNRSGLEYTMGRIFQLGIGEVKL